MLSYRFFLVSFFLLAVLFSHQFLSLIVVIRRVCASFSSMSVNHLQSFSLLTLLRNLLVSPVTSPYLAILFLQLILHLVSVSLVLKLNSIPIPIYCLSSVAYALCPLTLSLLYKTMLSSVFLLLVILLPLLEYLSFLSLLFH